MPSRIYRRVTVCECFIITKLFNAHNGQVNSLLCWKNKQVFVLASIKFQINVRLCQGHFPKTNPRSTDHLQWQLTDSSNKLITLIVMLAFGIFTNTCVLFAKCGFDIYIGHNTVIHYHEHCWLMFLKLIGLACHMTLLPFHFSWLPFIIFNKGLIDTPEKRDKSSWM